MRRTFGLFSLLFAITAGAAFAADPKLDAPPAGLTPSTVTVSQIIKRYDAAVGRLTSANDTRQETWKFTKAGLNGTETLTRQGFNFRSTITAGPIVQEFGQFEDSRWHKDPNGYVTPMQGIDASSFEMFVFMRNFADTEDPKNDVKMVGEVTDPQPDYVVQITRPNYRHPEFVFYNKKTGLIDEIINNVGTSHDIATYTDYRATKGLTQPWHVHETDGRPAFDNDFVRQSLVLGGDIDVRAFAAPLSNATFAKYSGHVDIPARVLFEDFYMQVGLGQYHTFSIPTVVVRVNVNGRGLDFELASGSPESVIDWDVARDLNLPSYGQTTQAPDGTPVPYDTMIPDVQIGGLTLHNFVMHALHFNYHWGGETKVVGTLGFDVLNSGVFKIDYDNGKVTLDPASTFDSMQPVPGAFAIPIRFDQGYAFLSGLLDSHFSKDIVLANDFSTSFILGNFTERYPDAVKDSTGKNHGSAFIPFADAGNYGREVDVWLGRIPDIQFGPAHFVQYDILGSNGDVIFAGHSVDAVLGADFLEYYDLYLDYPHSRILFKPNKLFARYFKVG